MQYSEANARVDYVFVELGRIARNGLRRPMPGAKLISRGIARKALSRFRSLLQQSNLE